MIRPSLVVAVSGSKVIRRPVPLGHPDGRPSVGYMVAAVTKVAGSLQSHTSLLCSSDLADTASRGRCIHGSYFGAQHPRARRVRRPNSALRVWPTPAIMTRVVVAPPTVSVHLAIYRNPARRCLAVVLVVGRWAAPARSITVWAGGGNRPARSPSSCSGMGGLPIASEFVAKFGVFTDAWAWRLPMAVIVAVICRWWRSFYIRVVVVMYIVERRR